MIDWSNLAANSLWIVGCALALATISYASWQAAINGEKITTCLSKPGYERALILAGALFSAGQFWLGASLLQRALWAILGALLLVLFWLSLRS